MAQIAEIFEKIQEESLASRRIRIQKEIDAMISEALLRPCKPGSENVLKMAVFMSLVHVVIKDETLNIIADHLQKAGYGEFVLDNLPGTCTAKALRTRAG